MASLNHVILIGNLGRDPEMRYSPSGQAATEFSMATSRSYKKDDQWVEATEWHSVKIWGNTAERAAEQLRKGSMVCVVGRLETRSWDDEKAGHKHYKTEIIAERFIPLDRRSDGGQAAVYAMAEAAAVGAVEGFGAASTGQQSRPSQPATSGAQRKYDDLDELPF